MNQNIFSKDFDNDICEAIDCNSKAVKTIEVNAGTYGLITIFLCTNCIDKFKRQNKK